MKRVLILTVIFSAIALIEYVTILFLCDKIRKQKRKIKIQQQDYIGLKNELNKMHERQKIKDKIEEETNEKINDLHCGKLSADDILPK